MTALLPLLSLDRWTWGFNDPTVMGWGLTLGYFAAALACGGAVCRSVVPQQRMDRTGWGLLALALLLLGLNKQLDLQNLLRDRAREWYLERGWYASRHWFIGIGLTGVLLALAGAAWMLRRGLPGLGKPLRRALTLLFLLGGVILLRFLPIPVLSRALGFSLLDSHPAVWHFHVVELVELALVGWMGREAWVGGRVRGK